LDFGEYVLVVKEQDGTVQEIAHANQPGWIPFIGATTDIPEIDDAVYRITDIHFSRDPDLAGVRAKKFMVARVICARVPDGSRPPTRSGSKFEAASTRPTVESVEQSERSGKTHDETMRAYREQATKLGQDADEAALAIANGRGWHLNPELPAELHALSRDAKRESVGLIFTDDCGTSKERKGPSLRLVPVAS